MLLSICYLLTGTVDAHYRLKQMFIELIIPDLDKLSHFEMKYGWNIDHDIYRLTIDYNMASRNRQFLGAILNIGSCVGPHRNSTLRYVPRACAFSGDEVGVGCSREPCNGDVLYIDSVPMTIVFQETDAVSTHGLEIIRT